MVESIEFETIIGKRKVPRRHVLQWESRRAKVVLEKLASRLGDRALDELAPDLSVRELSEAPLVDQRAALTRLKIELGHAGMYALLRRELLVSERMTRIGVTSSRGRTKHAVTELAVRGYSAERFIRWFDDLTATNAEADMLDACPDHYLLRGRRDGLQEVVETTGGSPAVTRFLVDYSRTDSLTIEQDSEYPFQIAGSALLDDGVVIGGVRHQFRDRAGNLEAKLSVQFPGNMPSKMIKEHQWHLACEFSNWLTAAAPTAGL